MKSLSAPGEASSSCSHVQQLQEPLLGLCESEHAKQLRIQLHPSLIHIPEGRHKVREPVWVQPALPTEEQRAEISVSPSPLSP